MIEITVRDFLEKMLTVPVVMEIPVDPPVRFVVLHKGDSSRENGLDTAMMVADSYAESLLEAAKLNEQVKSAMEELTELDEIASSRQGGDYTLSDTKNKMYRYQAIQNITFY